MEFMGYSFDSAWETFLRILPKYMNSHFYDIMAYCCGFAGFVVALLLRKRIKKFNRNCIEKKFSCDLLRRDPIEVKPLIIYRICNLFIPALAAIISIACFEVVAYLSTRIKIDTVWVWIIPFMPIAVYTLYEFWESGILGWLLSMVIILIIEKQNYDYCCEFEDHHKACYAIRVIVVTFGIIGLVKQFIPSVKDCIKFIKQKKNQERQDIQEKQDVQEIQGIPESGEQTK